MKTSFSSEEIWELIIEWEISRLVFDVAIFWTINFNTFVMLSTTKRMTKELLWEIQYYCSSLYPLEHRTYLIYNALTKNG